MCFFFFPNTDTDITASIMANAIIDWCAANDAPGGLMCGGRMHFKNEKIRLDFKPSFL